MEASRLRGLPGSARPRPSGACPGTGQEQSSERTAQHNTTTRRSQLICGSAQRRVDAAPLRAVQAPYIARSGEMHCSTESIEGGVRLCQYMQPSLPACYHSTPRQSMGRGTATQPAARTFSAHTSIHPATTPHHTPPRPLPLTRSFAPTPLLRISASHRSSDSLFLALTAFSPCCCCSFLTSSTASRLLSLSAPSSPPLSLLSSLPRLLSPFPFSGRPPCLS